MYLTERVLLVTAQPLLNLFAPYGVTALLWPFKRKTYSLLRILLLLS